MWATPRYLTPDLAAITYVALHKKSENRPPQGHIACDLNEGKAARPPYARHPSG